MTNSHPEDIEIINMLVQDGKNSDIGFKTLVMKYGESLFRQIHFMTKNKTYTDDILQNVFIKVYENLSSFKQESSLYTWLYRIARNETLNFLEKEKRRTGVKVEDHYFEIIAGHSVLDGNTSERISELLDQAIESLPEKQKLVFKLKYLEDLKYSEIAEKLKMSEGGLKANFHHAKQKIEDFILARLNH
jgi:RNA polymerase sigma-70 factor (ECF subfamily)